jgi:hypothetical protein
MVAKVHTVLFGSNGQPAELGLKGALELLEERWGDWVIGQILGIDRHGNLLVAANYTTVQKRITEFSSRRYEGRGAPCATVYT